MLICLSYYNKTPWTGQFVNNRNIFLTVLETGKSKIKALVDWFLLSSYFLDSYLFMVILLGEGSLGPLCQDLALTSAHFPKVSPFLILGIVSASEF